MRRRKRPLLLFLAATEGELAPLRMMLHGRHPGYEALFAVTGAGKACAACTATLAFASLQPDLGLLVGCAGALPGSGLDVGDVVVATRECFGDEGVETRAGFLDLRHLMLPVARRGGRTYYNEVPVARPARGSIERFNRRSGGLFAVRQGPLVTVSTCSGTPSRAAAIERRSGALAESMEGAAVALAALLLDRRLIEVRGISNQTGRRDRESWDIPAACRNAAEAILWIAEGEAVGSKR